MKGYHDLYLKCNVLLLAVIFKKIRNYALKNYGLCPSHYLSASDLMSKFLPTQVLKWIDPEEFDLN